MPRPRKCRRVCAMPENQGFEPLGKQGKCCGNKIVKMSIDEYETIRLIDWEKLTQVQRRADGNCQDYGHRHLRFCQNKAGGRSHSRENVNDSGRGLYTLFRR